MMRPTAEVPREPLDATQRMEVESPVGDGEAPLAARTSTRAHGWAHYAEAYALLLLTVLLGVFFTFLPATREVFPSIGNFQVTAAAQAVVVIIAVASLVPLICEEFDLSVGANAGMTSIFCASAMASGWPPIAAVALAIVIGGIVGIVNGLLITVARVNSFVTTLGTAALLAGIVQWKSGGQSIVAGIPQVVTDVGTNKMLGIPNSVYLAIVIAAMAYYVLRQTPFGRYLYAIGANRNAAELVGLRVDRLVLSTFVVSGLVCGLAGALQLAVSGTGNPRVGESFTLPALAAAFLSVAAIKPGSYNVWGAVVAIGFLAVLNSGLNLAGASNYVNNFANGGALILGVAMSAWLGRRRRLT
jgi:ribose transport system permease protein